MTHSTLPHQCHHLLLHICNYNHETRWWWKANPMSQILSISNFFSNVFNSIVVPLASLLKVVVSSLVMAVIRYNLLVWFQISLLALSLALLPFSTPSNASKVVHSNWLTTSFVMFVRTFQPIFWSIELWTMKSIKLIG